MHSYLRKRFARQGYIHLKKILSPDQVARLREKIGNDDTYLRRRVVQAPEVLREPMFEEVFKNPKIVKTALEIFDTGSGVAFYPSYQVQINSFTQATISNVSSGAHIDGIAEVEAQKKYIRDPVSSWANIGVYLQDYENSGYGGGVLILRYSHILIRAFSYLPFSKQLTSTFISTTRRLPNWIFSMVRTSEGDALVFDNRLIHTSNVGAKGQDFSAEELQKQHQKYRGDIPKEYRKISFYWFAGPAEHMPEVMHTNFWQRIQRTEESVDSGGFNYQKSYDMAEKNFDIVRDYFEDLPEIRPAKVPDEDLTVDQPA